MRCVKKHMYNKHDKHMDIEDYWSILNDIDRKGKQNHGMEWYDGTVHD